MKIRHGSAAVGVANLVLAGISVNTAAASAKTSLRDLAPPVTAVSQAKTTRVSIPLAHPLSLKDAIAVGASLQEAAIAYAFTNDNVVGEYSPAQGTPPNEYLSQFEANYGTVPMITSIVVNRVVDSHTASSLMSVLAVGADRPLFVAPPVKYGGHLAAMINQDSGNLAKTAVPNQARMPSAASALQDWRPQYTNISVLGGAGSSPFFWESYYWQNSGVGALPSFAGLEFEINEDNPFVFAPNNARPNFCGDPNYKEEFWAANHSYSWSVTNVYGGPHTAINAYADYNDATDLCRNNSIAIGLQHPQALTADPYGEVGLYVQVSPPQGFRTSSTISGNVQAVSKTWCDLNPGYSATDCMGVTNISTQWLGYPGGTFNRGTLDIARGFIVPSKCWTTDNFGSTLSEYSCFG